MKVYISGPMTGYPEHNYPAFHKEAEKWRAAGFEVVNPAELNTPEKDWQECMRRDIAVLTTVDAIVLLPGWENSRGARLELRIAMELGMRVIVQNGKCPKEVLDMSYKYDHIKETLLRAVNDEELLDTLFLGYVNNIASRYENPKEAISLLRKCLSMYDEVNQQSRERIRETG